jgi:hypothetical protein
MFGDTSVPSGDPAGKGETTKVAESEPAIDPIVLEGLSELINDKWIHQNASATDIPKGVR